jgi:hypothetical protein
MVEAPMCATSQYATSAAFLTIVGRGLGSAGASAAVARDRAAFVEIEEAGAAQAIAEALAA